MLSSQKDQTLFRFVHRTLNRTQTAPCENQVQEEAKTAMKELCVAIFCLSLGAFLIQRSDFSNPQKNIFKASKQGEISGDE